MNNLEKLLKIEKLILQKNLNEYIKVLIKIEKEYTDDDFDEWDTCRNGKDWNKCECC
jgi:hypothetical protein